MAAYAEVEDVQSRAGWLREAWGQNTKPSLGEIEGFLRDTAGEINGALAAGGFDADDLADATRGALLSLNADGALLLALYATYPGESGPTEAGRLLDAVRARWEAGLKALAEGKHIAILIEEELSGGEAASDFWTENPSYPEGFTTTTPVRDDVMGPQVYRGMAF